MLNKTWNFNHTVIIVMWYTCVGQRSLYTHRIDNTNLKHTQPVPRGGAVHLKVTEVFSVLLVWVAAVYTTHVQLQ